MMLKLHEIDKEAMALNAMIEDWLVQNDGDLTDFPLMDELERLAGDHEAKSLSLGAWVKNLKAEEKALADEVRNLQQRRQTLGNRITGITGYMAEFIEPGVRYKDERVVIGWRKSTAVNVICDPSALPLEYQHHEITAKKTDLKEAIASGKAVDGVELVERQNLQIR